MIKAVFYSKFDVREGRKVIHQVPSNSITPSPTSQTEPLVNFPSISATIIPSQAFCSLPLSILAHPYRVLTHPICLKSPSYERNEFIFSFSLVLHHRTATPAYAAVVAKLATQFKHLEETSHFLSSDTSPPDTGKIYAICEILLEDLNNYCETMIPVDDANTLDIKLFPTYAPPPPLLPHHVPLATVRLSALTDENWDLTMLSILPYIDGVNSVRAIARLADADYKLVRKAVAHLVYYGCCVLLDVFHFGASYAPSADMAAFVADADLQDECRHYVLPDSFPDDQPQPQTQAQQAHMQTQGGSLHPPDHATGQSGSSTATAKRLGSATSAAHHSSSSVASKDYHRGTPNPSTSTADTTTITSSTAAATASSQLTALRRSVDAAKLVELYASLRQGVPLRSWCMEHAELIGVLDVRRLITFGVIKGFLYRVHKYAVAGGSAGAQVLFEGPRNRGSVAAGGGGGGGGGGSGGGDGAGAVVVGGDKADAELGKFLDGTHCFDEICTELMLSERELMVKLKARGDVQIVQR